MGKDITIIYISDIHSGYSVPENQDNVLRAFIDDVTEQMKLHGCENNYLFIGGDLVYMADKPEQYAEFDKQIIQPIEQIGIARDHVICVPGNHDAQQSIIKENDLSYIPAIEQKYSETLYNNFIRQNRTIIDIFENYSKYVQEKLGISDYNILSYSKDLVNDWSVFCGNSALTTFAHHSQKEDRGYLGFDTRSLHNWLQRNDGKKKILLMHHPLDWFMEWTSTELKVLMKNNFDLILTGHTHEQDILCNINGSDSFIACKAPQLFTDKKDHELGYCLIKIKGSQITEIVYREWFSKRNKFRAGLSFTESDSGIISFVPETIINSSLEEVKVNDEVEILLKDKFQQDMIAYSGQPTIDWIDRFLSQKRIDRDRSTTHSEMISEEELFDNPRNIKILTPAEFGLTCYGRHFLLSLWQKRKQFGVLVEKVGLKKTKIENYVDAILKEFNKVAADVKWIILDEWNVTAKESQAILTIIKNLFPDAYIMLLSPRLEKYFQDTEEIRVLEQDFELLFMTPICRSGVRSLVKSFNDNKFIADNEIVLKRVDDDIKNFNMHRTPLNCITLLLVFNNSFEENPVNRTAVVEKILNIIFDNNETPTYKSDPDVKDCEFSLGYFCEQIIKTESYFFSREFFYKTISSYCDQQFITLDVNYLFDILLNNQIIAHYDNTYCFRFTYWVYYFAAMQMHNNPSFASYILTEKRYIHYPEIMEFYTGKDRRREDAAKLMIDDLNKASESVHEKVGIPDEWNPFMHLKCEQSQEQSERMLKDLENNLQVTKLPDEIKDSIADMNYDQTKPFNQAVFKVLEDYSVVYLIESIHLASKTLRNCDYITPTVKQELFDAIFNAWHNIVRVISLIAPKMAQSGYAGYDGAFFELAESFNEEKDIAQRLMRIIVAIPHNIIEWFKDDMYSEKNAKLLYRKIDSESNKVKKHLAACVILKEQPPMWADHILKYITNLGSNSFYIGNITDLMSELYQTKEMDESDLSRLKKLLKTAIVKLHTGENRPSLKLINQIRDKDLPERRIDSTSNDDVKELLG